MTKEQNKKKEPTTKKFEEWNSKQSAKNQIQDLIIFEEITEINYEYLMTKNEFEYIRDVFFFKMCDLIKEYGTEDYVSIKDEMRNELTSDDLVSLYGFFNLSGDHEDKINELIKESKKVRKLKDLDGGFYNNYIVDDSLQRLIFLLNGYDLTNDSAQDTYTKETEAIIPTSVIREIFSILNPHFNKISLLSNKNNDRIGHIILLNLNNISDKLNNLYYRVCNTEDTRTVLLSTSNQLLTLVDYLEGNKKQLFDGMGEGYSSSEDFKEDGKGGPVYE